MKNIVLFITALTQGGAERQLLLLGKQLIEKGYYVTLVTYVDTADHYVPDSKIKRIRLAPGQSKLKKIIAIYRYFKSVNTDIVISYAERNSFLAIPGLLFRKHIKIIASERNFKLNNGPLMNILRRIFYRRADSIVPNSYAQGEFLCSLSKSIASKVTIITNYTDIQSYFPKAIDYNSTDSQLKHLKLCVFARYDLQKNYTRLANAVAILKQHKGINFSIDWFGKNTDINGNLTKSFIEFDNLIKILDLESIINLYPASKNVSTLLHKYDGFLLPSLFEGFSNSLSEAIASGLPCIVSDVSDNKIMVKDGVNGYLFNPENEQSIANALDKFQNISSDQLILFGHNSRKIAERIFDLDDFTQKYLSLF